jgi:hypothetical protein
LPSPSPRAAPLTSPIFPSRPPRLPPLPRTSLRWCRRWILSLCGLLSALALAAAAAAGSHPLALLAALLPLQVAGLLWLVTRLG